MNGMIIQWGNFINLLSFICSALGLFSDSHVLALMYGGEMCYWYLKFNTSRDRNHPPHFKAKEQGRSMLETFIKSVKGPLNGAGWDCSKAQEMLIEIEKL